jgi:hypothetical protein
MWPKFSSFAAHLLHNELVISTTKYRFLLGVLRPVRRQCLHNLFSLPAPTPTTSFRGAQAIFRAKYFHVQYPTFSPAVTLRTHSHMKMGQTVCSEMLAFKLQMPGNNRKKAYEIQNTAKVWNRGLGLCAERTCHIFPKHIRFLGSFIAYADCIRLAFRALYCPADQLTSVLITASKCRIPYLNRKSDSWKIYVDKRWGLFSWNISSILYIRLRILDCCTFSILLKILWIMVLRFI